MEISMTRVSRTLWQKIRLYNPSGALIAEVKDVAHAVLTTTLPESGTCTILASDEFNRRLTGSYSIGLQKLP